MGGPVSITALLADWREGRGDAGSELFGRIYEELRRLAGRYTRGEAAGPLQPSALVHEVYLPLLGADPVELHHRRCFLDLASKAMRRVLVDIASSGGAARRGGDVQFATLDGQPSPSDSAGELLAVNEALDRLAAREPRQAQVVEMRYFGGLSAEEAGEALGIPPKTVKRDWHVARLWLHQEIAGTERWIVEQEERAKDLFAEAVEKPPLERRNFVRAAAADDPEAREAVLRMIEQEERAAGFLETPAIGKGGLADVRSDRSFSPGEVVAGRYRVVRRLGAGGMGEVYEAHDERLNQRVALKTILPRFGGDERFMLRFRREIALARRVTHRNVCRVYDLGEHRDAGDRQPVTFLSMEFLDGETLADRLRRERRLDTHVAAELAVQLAEALDAAHDANVVHRDFKPGNVILTSGPGGPLRAVITDFGLAHGGPADEQAGDTLTRTGAILGTPGYMAPEQLAGGEATAATDIYAFGLVIFEMVTGRRFFGAPEARTVTEGPPGKAAERAAAPGLGPGWDEAIARCLHPEPGRRFRSAKDFVTALDLQGASRQRRSRWRRRALVAAALGGSLLAAFGGYRSGWFSGLPKAKHIAVLPFAAPDDRGEDRAFADGVTESVTEGLSRLERFDSGLWVVPASRIREYGLSPVEAAREGYGVNLVLLGSIEGHDRGYRLSMRLVNARTGSDIKHLSLSIPGPEMSLLVERTVAMVADELGVEIQPVVRAALTAGETRDPEAYRLCQEGLGYLRSPDTGNLGPAIECLRRAVELDPLFARAYARLAEAYWRRASVDDEPADVELAKNTLNRAGQLEPDLTAVYLTRGMIERSQGSLDRAVWNYRRALDLDPNDGEALAGLALTYSRQGNAKLAEETYKKAIRLRPEYWLGYNDLGAFYVENGRFTEAADLFTAVTRLIPDSSIGFENLGGVLLYAGRIEEAEKTLRRSIEIKPSAEAYSNLAVCAFQRGEHRRAAQLQEEAVRKDPRIHIAWRNLGDYYQLTPGSAGKAREAYREAARLAEDDFRIKPRDADLASVLALYHAKLQDRERAVAYLRECGELATPNLMRTYEAAAVHALLGDRAEALKHLGEAIRQGYPAKDAARDPDFAGLQGDPEFQKMLAGAPTSKPPTQQ